MYCGFCGKPVADNHQYCPYCGAKTVNQSYTYQNNSSYYNGSGTYQYGYNGYTGYTQSTVYTDEPVKNYNLISAFLEMFKKYAQFNGRSRRSAYWYATLMNAIIVMAAYTILIFLAIAVAVGNTPSAASMGLFILLCLVIVLYCFGVMVPCIALGVRRLHDTGRSGLYMLMSLIPYVGSIILIVFMSMDSQPGPNQYGPNPKGM